MTTAHPWHPITDLEGDPKALTEGELDSLKRIWQTQKAEMADQGGLEEFNKRLRREWAIETGIIENVYTLDRGTTLTLIERGIDAALIPHSATDRDTTLVARIIQDHYETVEGLFDFVGGQRELSTGYIKELHAALLRNVDTYSVVDPLGRVFEKDLPKGKYKTEPNSPTRPDGSIHPYCPPEHVAAEMDRLVEMHAEHENSGVPVEVEAAWVHHRFSQIHPFADGNGRVARAIASLVFIKADWFPLIIKRDDRVRYIDALEKADADDLRPLSGLFAEAQRKAVIQATELIYEVKPVQTEEEAIAAVRNRLVQRGKLPLREWLPAKATAEQLTQVARERLTKTAQQLQQELGMGREFNFQVIQAFEEGDAIVAAITHEAGHTPDLAEFNRRVELALCTGRNDSLVVSFYGIGPRFRGFIGVAAYLAIPGAEPQFVPGGQFQTNYEEDPEKARTRFSTWLDRMIVEGLNAWRETL